MQRLLSVSRTLALLVSLTLVACSHDPAWDRPIEPWGSPNVPPTTAIGDDGGGWTGEPRDAGTTD